MRLWSFFRVILLIAMFRGVLDILIKRRLRNSYAFYFSVSGRHTMRLWSFFRIILLIAMFRCLLDILGKEEIAEFLRLLFFSFCEIY